MASVGATKKKLKISNNKKRKIVQWIDQAKLEFAAGNLQQAQDLCQQVLAIDAEHPDAFHVLGLIADKLGDAETARTLLTLACEKCADDFEIWWNLGRVHSTLEDDTAGLNCWQQCIRLKPSDADAWQNMSTSLQRLGNTDAALQAAQKAVDLIPSNAILHNNLGFIYEKLYRFPDAEAAYRQAVELDPEYAEGQCHLADCLLSQGHLEEGYKRFETAIKIDPRQVTAHQLLLIHRKVTDYDEYVRQAEALYNDPDIPSKRREELAFALGKAWADMEDYGKSFSFYAEGNRMRRAEWEYNFEDDLRDTEEIMHLFSKDFLDARCQDRDAGEALLFIVGMPRSGSTLTDQILSAHPDVVSIGETDLLRNVTTILAQDETNHINLQNLMQVTDVELKNAGDAYMNSIQRVFGESKRYADKALTNMWLIGIIRMVFPQARILHCSRNALDNCISIFSYDFAGYLHKYGYNLTELGKYYRLHLRMMEHWRKVLPADVFRDVHYEALVDDPETEIRALLDFCGMEWHDGCLNFHQSRRVVSTASVAQVRKPIYRSAVNRWEHYKPWLGELINALEGKSEPRMNANERE